MTIQSLLSYMSIGKQSRRILLHILKRLADAIQSCMPAALQSSTHQVHVRKPSHVEESLALSRISKTLL